MDRRVKFLDLLTRELRVQTPKDIYKRNYKYLFIV